MAAVVLGVLLSLTGCGSEEDPAHEVRTGQIEEVPAKAVAGDRQVEIGLPTGVLKVKLNAGQDEAPTPSGDLAPGDGLPWSDWHGHSKPIGALKGETFSWAVVPRNRRPSQHCPCSMARRRCPFPPISRRGGIKG